MVNVQKESDMKQFLVGCDEDIGGLSRAKLEWDPKHKGQLPLRLHSGLLAEGLVFAARFYGHLNGFAPPGAKLGGFQLERSGYAGMRTGVSIVSLAKSEQRVRAEPRTFKIGSEDHLWIFDMGHFVVQLPSIEDPIATFVLCIFAEILCEPPNGRT